MKKETYKTAAVLTIRRADQMSPRGRTEIAGWLHKQAVSLELYGKEYDKDFRARFQYREATAADIARRSLLTVAADATRARVSKYSPVKKAQLGRKARAFIHGAK